MNHGVASLVVCGLALSATSLTPGIVYAAAGGLANPASPNPLSHPASPTDLPAMPVRPAPALPASPAVPVSPAVPASPPLPAVAPVVQPPAAPAPDAGKAAAAEAPFLTGHVQITFPAQFAKAGEAYFEYGANPKWIIFQAIEAGSTDTNYQMFVAKLTRDASGNITGLDPAVKPIRLSGPKSSNTCGWFAPTEPGRVIFGSTIAEPKDDSAPGFSRDKQSYSWKFPPEMRIVTRTIEAIVRDKLPAGEAEKLLAERGDVKDISPAFELPSEGDGPGYAAECSFTADGRFILFTYLDPKTKNPDIWVLDTQIGTHTPLVTAKGYNGGPFFSPNGKRIVYRSDRKGDSNLQLFAADLEIDPVSGAISGIKKEIQLTDDANVNWTPFWHPSGEYLIFASSKASHRNYEVYSIDATGDKPAAERVWKRVTECDGFDGLPVFSSSGELMMWTSQRGGRAPGEEKPSSQIWIAKVMGKPTKAVE